MKEKKKEKEASGKNRLWVLCITVSAFFLSVFMSLFSDVILKNANIFAAFAVLIVIILIGIFFDILGVAVTVADPAPFNAMASSKVRGAKSSLILIKHASRVSNICNDVVGDTCGIISGTSTAYIALQLAQYGIMDSAVAAIVLSGFAASATIGGKALGKESAILNAKKIIQAFGRISAVFLEKRTRKRRGS